MSKNNKNNPKKIVKIDFESIFGNEEEKKSTEIALVAASERADSLNPCMCKFQDVAACGVVGSSLWEPVPPMRSYKIHS